MQHQFTFGAEEKLYLLTFRCHSCLDRPNSQEREKMLGDDPLGWKKVKDDDDKTVLTSVYTKNIRGENYGKELEQLKLMLASFRGSPVPEKAEVRFTLSIAIHENEIGDSIEGVQYLFGTGEE